MFTYAVPLSTFDSLLTGVDESLRHEFYQRMKEEIHADLARRMMGPSVRTSSGYAESMFDSSIVNGDMVFYSPLEMAEVLDKTGEARGGLRRFLFAKTGLGKEPETVLAVSKRKWRYPGGAAGGMFSTSVNSVLAASRPIVQEFRRRSR